MSLSLFVIANLNAVKARYATLHSLKMSKNILRSYRFDIADLLVANSCRVEKKRKRLRGN